jgi:hypothetical protein
LQAIAVDTVPLIGIRLRRMHSEAKSPASAIIDLLGGTSAFGRWWGADKRKVSRWRREGFPTKTYIDMSQRLLNERGIEAPVSAWNFERGGES